MNDDSGNPRQTSNSSTIALVFLLLPLLYALSIGPVTLFFSKYPGMKSVEDSATIFYAPMFWLYDHTSLKQPLDSYMAWWERLGSRKM